jgi:16S rRNA (guanine966-N2)-methyltransferase
VFAALRGSIRERVDVIFMDPPYNQEYEKRVLEILKDAPYIDNDTLIVVEAAKETDLDYVESLGFAIEKEKIYKTNKHIFVKKL